MKLTRQSVLSPFLKHTQHAHIHEYIAGICNRRDCKNCSGSFFRLAAHCNCSDNCGNNAQIAHCGKQPCAAHCKREIGEKMQCVCGGELAGAAKNQQRSQHNQCDRRQEEHKHGCDVRPVKRSRTQCSLQITDCPLIHVACRIKEKAETLTPVGFLVHGEHKPVARNDLVYVKIGKRAESRYNKRKRNFRNRRPDFFSAAGSADTVPDALNRERNGM